MGLQKPQGNGQQYCSTVHQGSSSQGLGNKLDRFPQRIYGDNETPPTRNNRSRAFWRWQNNPCRGRNEIKTKPLCPDTARFAVIFLFVAKPGQTQTLPSPCWSNCIQTNEPNSKKQTPKAKRLAKRDKTNDKSNPIVGRSSLATRTHQSLP